MKRILSAILLAALCVAILSSVARADIAPPQQPPGSNPGPGNESTQVRMMTETVTIDVLTVDPPQAHVSAFFTMRNLGDSTEFLAVRFPIAANDGWHMGFSEIKNVSIKVDDQVTSFGRIQGPEPTFGSDNNVPWAEFGVSFPPGKDVQIKVSYDLDGTSYPEETYTRFYYILSTGAGWNGTIGSGEIILRLPYEANPQNVVLEYSPETPQFVGREAHWTFTELEPTTENNFIFDIVKPVVWNQVVAELENTSRNPQDGESYGRLGKAYKQAFFATGKSFPRTDPGAALAYQWSKDAYSKAVTLKPDDGLWHAGYAELLLNTYRWTYFDSHLYTDDLHLGLKEFDLACQLAPKDPKVLELIEWYTSSFPDYIAKKPDGSLEFISLTQTPLPLPEESTATQTPISTEVPQPTSTEPPTSEPATALPATPTPKPASPVCGGMALLLLPVALIAWRFRKNRSTVNR